jgi:predicted transcriptional regulator of viral defense system
MKDSETLEVLTGFAEAHHGLVALWRVPEIDEREPAVRALARRGWLVRVGPGVFRVAGSVRTWRQALLGTVWAAGTDAVAARGAAARLWGLRGFDDGPIEVLRSRHCRRMELGVLETAFLPAHHVAEVDGIPVTSVERTLFDVCGYFPARCAHGAVVEALARGLTAPQRLVATLTETAARGRPGSAAMRRILDAVLAVDSAPGGAESTARTRSVAA